VSFIKVLLNFPKRRVLFWETISNETDLLTRANGDVNHGYGPGWCIRGAG
jgi:hypothetical protein